MIRLLRIFQGELCRAAPAIRLRAKIGDLVYGAAQKTRHAGRNFLSRNAVDVGVTLVPPSESGIGLQKNEGDQRQLISPRRKPRASHFTVQNCSTPSARNQNARCSDELQEAWAANGVLDHAQAALRGESRRTLKVGEKGNVVVRSVEIGMVENIERVGFKVQTESFLDWELFGQAHVEAHLERARKVLRPVVPYKDSKSSHPLAVASRHSVGSRGYELGSRNQPN